MHQKRHTPEQIVVKMREAEEGLSRGLSIADICRKLGVSEQTFHRWRNEYGGIKAESVKRLKQLEAENGRLKRLVANQALDIEMLKEVARGNF